MLRIFPEFGQTNFASIGALNMHVPADANSVGCNCTNDSPTICPVYHAPPTCMHLDINDTDTTLACSMRSTVWWPKGILNSNKCNDEINKQAINNLNNDNNLRRSERIKALSKIKNHNVIDSSININIIMDKHVTNSDSAISKHQYDMKHSIDWNGCQIVWSDNNSYKLLIKESLIIKAYQPSLNRTTHSTPLYIFPEGLKDRHLPTIKRYK
ncbi:unnamed protein product [Rotaria socialis]|uniref:Uncharacterized protein n=1 Tax=Rotaria socialis TaxID=392032 RepID=A0A818A955_9BILA|nr:unnamed protein product [Rotaria socialis]